MAVMYIVCDGWGISPDEMALIYTIVYEEEGCMELMI